MEAYLLRVWFYPDVPQHLQALFPPPETEHVTAIVEQRYTVPPHLRPALEWIAPNGVWWSLWNTEQEYKVDETTTVYRLVSKDKAQDVP